MVEPEFRMLSEEECFKIYGFSKADMEILYNDGKPLIKKGLIFEHPKPKI